MWNCRRLSVMVPIFCKRSKEGKIEEKYVNTAVKEF